MLVPMAEWRRLQRAARPTLKELLLAPAPRGELGLPARGQAAAARAGGGRLNAVYLLDTNVVSELRRGEAARRGRGVAGRA